MIWKKRGRVEVTLFGLDFQIERRMDIPDPLPSAICVPICRRVSSIEKEVIDDYIPPFGIIARYEAMLMPGIYVRVK